jgi:hypothetical protein
MAAKSTASYSILSSNSPSLTDAKNTARHRRYTAIRLALAVLGLLSLFGASIAFWIYSSKHQILFPPNIESWLQARPKYATNIWTVSGTVLSFVTLLCLGEVLSIAAAQHIAEHGASVSAIEGKLCFPL